MALLQILKNNAVTILIVIAVVSVGAATYEHFFSDKTELIAKLEEQAAAQEQRIDSLNARYELLNEMERTRLEEITKLKTKIATIINSITSGEAKLNAIKNSVLGVDSALAVIEGHTRGILDRGLPPADTSTGK